MVCVITRCHPQPCHRLVENSLLSFPNHCTSITVRRPFSPWPVGITCAVICFVTAMGAAAPASEQKLDELETKEKLDAVLCHTKKIPMHSAGIHMCLAWIRRKLSRFAMLKREQRTAWTSGT